MSTTTSTVKKYFARINQTEEELAKQDNLLKAKGASLSNQQEVLRVQKEIAQKQILMEGEKSNVNFSSKTIYSIQNQIDLLERELTFYENLHKELF